MTDAETLLAGLLARTERDKADIARQLHGELGGALAAVRLSLATLRGAGAEVGANAVVLDQVDAQLVAAQALKQRLVEALHPGLLDHFGLGVALPAHLEAACRAAGVSYSAKVGTDLPLLSPEPSILLYRLGEHAGAALLRDLPRSLHLGLSGGATGLCLRLRCEGAAPLLTADPAVEALGHWLMRSGGRFSISSTAEGSELEAVLP